jgi:hypothetical protein
MAKRKISVEEFTNDVLAGMTDAELMQKYRISRKHLEAMFAKLLQRGELQAADLTDATQRGLEPTLELAATCPHCGALNLFGTGLCPECGQSRITRHFKAVDTQEMEPLRSDSHAETPQKKTLLSGDAVDRGDLEGLADVDVTDKAKAAAGQERIESAPQHRPRRLFLLVAAAALFVLIGVVAVGLYTETISLPFGDLQSPPAAVQKPIPQPAPGGPEHKRIAGKSPSRATQPPKQLPAEPVHAQPAPVSEKAPPEASPAMPVPSVPPVEKPAVETPKEPVREKAEAPSPVKATQETLPARAEEPASSEPPKVEPPVPVEKPAAVAVTRKTSPEKPPQLASVSPSEEPDRHAKVEEPAAMLPTHSQPPETAQPDNERSAETPIPEPTAVNTPKPPSYRQAALPATVQPRIEAPTRPRHGDMGPLLIESIKNGDRDMVRVLMDGGADPDSADPEGATALMYAARTRCLSCVAALLKRGADVRLKDRHGDTALDIARRAGRTRAAELILAHDPEKGPVALLIASREGIADLVQCLVENGVDVNATDPDGNTALMAASERGNLDIVSILLGKGADVRAYNKQGQTALTVVSRPHSATGKVPTRIRRELVRMLEQHTTPGSGLLQHGR